jgi:hypothetical protein
MRNIAFSHTERQFLNGTKTVTRRLGWRFLKPGEIEVLAVNRERLWDISQPDVVREGFPKESPMKFAYFFSHAMKCRPDAWVTRIEFRRVDAAK